jgi:hypothetical protein
MKLRSSFCALITAALFVGSTRLAVNAEHELLPLQSLAVRICGEGHPFPTSRLFDYFELDVPFLILTVGSEMTAAPVSQCRNFRTVEIESFYLCSAIVAP